MKDLNFYTVDLDYVRFLKEAEIIKRGFSRVPDMDYGPNHKEKFLCGIVLAINDWDYYVPVSSYKIQKPDNFLIYAKTGRVVSSLRFNYMFPVPKELISERIITTEPDTSYRTLLLQELQYCIKNQTTIRKLAERTYRRVLLGKNPGLVANSCDFCLLEKQSLIYVKNLMTKEQHKSDLPPRLDEQIKNCEKKKAKTLTAHIGKREHGSR